METEKKLKHRGIPEAVFITDLDTIESVEEGQSRFLKVEEMYRKYKVWEQNLVSELNSYRESIPPIKQSLDMVGFLKRRKEEGAEALETKFNLSETLYAGTKIKNYDKILLWLGANIMMEFTLDEAETLLSENIKKAQEAIEELESDLKFLRNQITITEVSKSRIHNRIVLLNKRGKKE